MCRHVAYLGPEASLRSLLIDPPHGLYRQAWAPRMQRHGTVNADGFGIGWYAAGDPVPARYRRAGPIWGDASLPDVARVTRSAAVLAAVRDATAGTASGEAAAAPFASGSWLFSHNGLLAGWPASATALLARAEESLAKNTHEASTMAELKKTLKEKGGVVRIPWCGKADCEEKMKAEAGGKILNVPLNQRAAEHRCAVCGEGKARIANFGKSY